MDFYIITFNNRKATVLYILKPNVLTLFSISLGLNPKNTELLIPVEAF